MGFTTEELVETVIKDVSNKNKIDAKRIFVLAWSSGGPAAYAAMLKEGSSITGGILAMSVFKPNQLPPLENGSHKSFYILHSEEDPICPYRMAKQGYDQLTKAGIRAKLVTYPGGHGWRGDVFGNIREGVKWMEKGDANTDK